MNLAEAVAQYHDHVFSAETSQIVLTILFGLAAIGIVVGVTAEHVGRAPTQMAETITTLSVIAVGLVAVGLVIQQNQAETRESTDLAAIGRIAAENVPEGAVTPNHEALGRCVAAHDVAAIPAAPTPCEARVLDGDSVATYVLVVGNDRVQWVRSI